MEEQKKDWRELYSNNFQMQKQLMANAKIPRRYQWADLLLDFPSIAENFDPDASYFIHGPVGGGKTYLMCAMVKAVILSRWYRREVVFVTARNMLASIQRGFSSVRADYVKYLDDEDDLVGLAMADCLETHYAEAELLALDDLGTEHVTDWAEGTLREILNHRYNELLPTYITSTHSLETLAEKSSQQLASRIEGEYHIIKVCGTDRRTRS